MESLQINRTEKANYLHQKILANGKLAANALVAMCKDLKSMRDERLYEELKYDSFEDYAEKACGIKQRQAYCYISAYEKLGVDFIEDNANLGITKLELISQVSSYEREEFLDENDVGEMSTRELKEKLAEYKKQNEQLTLDFTNVQEKLEETESDLKDSNEDLDSNAELIEKLKQELKEERANKEISMNPDEIKKQVEVEKEKLKKVYEQSLEQEKKNLEKENSEAFKKAIEKAKKEAKGEAQEIIDKLEKEKQITDSRLQQALKDAKISNADEDTIAVRILFADLQSTANKILEHIEKIKVKDNDKGTKLGGVIKNTLQQLINDFE